MRIQSIHEVNTRQKQNPFTKQFANTSADDKPVSNTTFDDLLKSYFQQLSVPVAGNSTEQRIAGIYGGFLSSMPIRPEREQTLKTNAN